jgi:beta-glucosidase
MENFLGNADGGAKTEFAPASAGCRKPGLGIGLCLAASLLAASPALAQSVCSNRQTPQQIGARVDALIDRMTVAEQVAQLQDRAPAIPRLGLPAYNWWNEGLHGLARDGYATVFPQAIGLAATWDPALLREVGDTVSTEAQAKFNSRTEAASPRYGGLTIWSPNINIFRDPRWGRGQETYGEDPFLTAALGTQFVQGVQGDDAFYLKADATPKHFVAHSGPEQGRDSFRANASPHDLADTYLPAFHALLAKGRAAALMCSYNAIDGVPSCANRLLEETVRKQWGFGGYIVSDCDAVGNLTDYQHYAPDAAHGAAAALNAGVDLDCGNSYLALADSLRQHLVTEAAIRQALRRLLLARVRLGMMDAAGCTPFDGITRADNDTPAHRALALRAAEESVVLLKNDGTLPLDPAQRRIAVVGPNADSLNILEANYHGTASRPVTPLDGLLRAFPKLVYAQGSLLAAGVAAPIPRTALRVAADPASAEGLAAEYFANPNLEGEPAVAATTPTVDLDLDRVGPTPALTAARYSARPRFSARWTGFLVPPAPGEYVLHVKIERCWDCAAHDRFQLFVDGKLAIDNTGEKTEPDRAALRFADSGPHAIRLQLEHVGDDEGITLAWEPPAEAQLDEAVRAAKSADAIVAFVGLSPDLEGEALQVRLDGFNGGDRTSLDLPAAQQALLARLQSLGKPLVIVLASGSAVALGSAQQAAAAILEAWYPGEEGGDAIADLLSGKANPSGRLPVTFYRSVADLPAFEDYSMARRTYRYFDGPVLYPFGFGLSYTRFRYSGLRLDHRALTPGEPLAASIDVENVGAVAGSEVAELYLASPQVPGAPRLALAGIERLRLAPGERRTLRFAIDPAQLTVVDPEGKRVAPEGGYRVFIGGAQPAAGQWADAEQSAGFRVAPDGKAQ